MATIGTSSVLGNLGSSYQLTQARDKNSKELGQEEFMMLMMTQFKNQDPLKPQDPTAFLAQLAQMTSVTSMAEMKTSISQLADSLYAGQALQAAGVVGRDVLAPADSTWIDDGGSIRGAVALPESTASGFVRIFDQRGLPVREFSLGNRPAGLADFTWDGTDLTGASVPHGQYHIVAGYRTENGETAADTFIAKRVASVALGGEGRRTEITTSDNQTLGLSDVRAIY